MQSSSFSSTNSEPLFVRVARCPHWKEGHIEIAKTTNNFRHIGDLVCEIAEKMPKPLFMISGPMTTGGLGNYSKNIVLFQHAIDEATKAGVSVFNQTMLEEHLQRLVREWLASNPGSDYCEYVLTDVYDILLGSGHISGVYFLPDWETSRGARWEKETATKHNLAQHAYPEDWYKEAEKRTEDFFKTT